VQTCIKKNPSSQLWDKSLVLSLGTNFPHPIDKSQFSVFDWLNWHSFVIHERSRLYEFLSVYEQ